MKYNDINIQNRIMEQVSQLIEESGIKGWNMDKLAERSGLAKNTLYRVIGKKEDIVKKVVLEYIRSIQKKMIPLVSDESDYMKSLENLIKLFPALLDGFYTEHMQNIFLEYPAIEMAVMEHRDEITGSIIGFISKGVKAGFLRSDLEPGILFAMLQSVVMHYSKLSLGKNELTKELERAFNYIIYGVKK